MTEWIIPFGVESFHHSTVIPQFCGVLVILGSLHSTLLQNDKELTPKVWHSHSNGAESSWFCDIHFYFLGHIGIAVPDVYEACKRFDELGVKYIKKPDDGKMKGVAFIQDPDEYWIEILNPRAVYDIVASVS